MVGPGSGARRDSELLVRSYPVVGCAGRRGRAPGNAWRLGASTCRAAAELPAKTGACPSGCLGLGDCAQACPREALLLSPSDALLHFREHCSGCGSCVQACPRNVIRLVPVNEPVQVRCSAPGGAGGCCTRCGECVRACPRGAIVLARGGPNIDRKRCESCGRCAEACHADLLKDGRGDPLARW